MTEIEIDPISKNAYIDHDPANCIDSNGNEIGCIYMFAIENTNDAEAAIVSINIENEDHNPGDIKLN